MAHITESGGGRTVNRVPTARETPASKPQEKQVAKQEARVSDAIIPQEDKAEFSPQAQQVANNITSLPEDVHIPPPRTYSNVEGCTQEQCAEWVQRVFRENGRSLPVRGDAATLFPKDWGEGYQKQTNGQPGLSPQAGDILCWGSSENNPWGHVAIIKEVHIDGQNSYITVVEANVGTNDGVHVPTRNIPYDPVTNTVKQTGSCPVQGWIHPEGDKSLVNAPPGQPGNYVPYTQMPAAPTQGGVPQALGVNQPVNTVGQVHGNNPQVSAGQSIFSPAGVQLSQDIAQLIMAAWQEVASGNFNGPNIQKLEQWYKNQDPNSQDPIKMIAANILLLAGKIIGQPSGMTPLGGTLPMSNYGPPMNLYGSNQFII